MGAPGALRRPGEQRRRARGSCARSRPSASRDARASPRRSRAGSRASSRARRAPLATAASGLCTQRHGTLASWLVQALNLVTGHLDEVGGMMLTTPAVDVVAILSRLGMRGTYDRWRSRARHLPEFGGELPVATLADEIETAGPGRVRALVTIAGNPVLSAPNGRRLDRALGTLDHVVSIDRYLNETTRHAHVLLPPAPPLSRAHYDLALYAFAVRNVAKYSEPVIPRQASERLDWEILAELAGRVFVPRPASPARPAAPPARSRPERIVDALLRIGPHRLTLARLRQVRTAWISGRSNQDGSGIGSPRPIAWPTSRRTTSSARRATSCLADADRETTGELVLIGRRQLRNNNSWMHNSRRLVKGPPRCTLLVHPERCRVAPSGRRRSGAARIGRGHDRRAGRSDRRDAARRRQPAARLGARSRRHPPGRRARPRRRERQRRDERPRISTRSAATPRSMALRSRSSALTRDRVA